MKELSIENQIYLCKYHDVDTAINKTIGLNKTEVEEILKKLKNNGLYDQYRKLDDDEYYSIIKSENSKHRAELRKSKEERLLDRYYFDKELLGYKYLIEVIKLVENGVTINISDLLQKVSIKLNIPNYKVRDEIVKLFNKAYKENRESFNSEFGKKPTLREFIIAKVEVKENAENKVENEKTVIFDITSEKFEKMETSNDHIPTIEEGFVKVPIKTLMNWSYMKGQLDTILDYQKREELKRKVED